MSHGGTDSGPFIAHDFSTNANPLGPPPALWRAVQSAERRRYPDPAYTALRERLAAFHGVSAARIVPAAGGAEAIRRMTLAARLEGITAVRTPQPGFGDYALAAQALGMQVNGEADARALVWACEPGSPEGGSARTIAPPEALLVIDRAYEPLRLEGSAPEIPEAAWQLFCPNKALGLTGIRAAYLVAPEGADTARVEALAASWVLSAEGEAMLMHWPDAEPWLAECRAQLRPWKSRQRALLAGLGWLQRESCTNFWLAKPPHPIPALDLRRHGIKLRDATSFGLPGWVRIAALPPESQDALMKALTT